MVLNTDMSLHFQQIKNMKQLLSMPENQWRRSLTQPMASIPDPQPSQSCPANLSRRRDPDQEWLFFGNGSNRPNRNRCRIDKEKALALMLHCADISHPGKRWDLHYRWTLGLLEEFFRQGDRERALDLPCSPLCDRTVTMVAQSQVGFIDFIMEPSFNVLGDMLEKILGPLFEQQRKAGGSAGPDDDGSASESGSPSIRRPWADVIKENRATWKARAEIVRSAGCDALGLLLLLFHRGPRRAAAGDAGEFQGGSAPGPGQASDRCAPVARVAWPTYATSTVPSNATCTHTACTHTTCTHTTCTHTACTHTTCTTCTHTTCTHTTCTHTTCTHTACTHTHTCTHTACTHTASTHTACTHTACTHTASTHTTCTHAASTHTTCNHPTFSLIKFPPQRQYKLTNPIQKAAEFTPEFHRHGVVDDWVDGGVDEDQKAADHAVPLGDDAILRRYKAVVGHHQALLDSAWSPSANYSMPYSTRIVKGKPEKRYLRHEHLQKHSFLAFSEARSGLFCRFCALFGPASGDVRNQQLGFLVSKPLTTAYHQDAMARAATFKQQAAARIDVVKQLDEARQRQAAENRNRLRPIVKTLLLCGRQNIPLRGHRDDGPLSSGNSDTSDDNSMVSGSGNFRALLQFRVDAGDEALEKHLKNSAANATYISKTIQKELLEAAGCVIQETLATKVNAAKCFSVLMDETCDNSKKKQMEDFLGFAHVTDQSGSALAAALFSFLEKLGINYHLLVGQGYDGAAAMRASGSCRSRRRKLLTLCDTRWVERNDAVLVFSQLFASIVEFLDFCESASDCDPRTAAKAQMLKAACTMPNFIVALHMMGEAVIRPLSSFLQKVSIDLFTASKHIENVRVTLEKMQAEASTAFKSIWSSASEAAAEADVELRIPRRRGCQQGRGASEDTPEEHFRADVYEPFLQHILSQFQQRFGDQAQHDAFLQLTCLLPKYVHLYDVKDFEPLTDCRSSAAF
uniref:PDEase domain-containing protein n=1 Tax=Macrostomum lignano TaxID=282301 RepID=A0A1I8IU29_9PLAT